MMLTAAISRLTKRLPPTLITARSQTTLTMKESYSARAAVRQKLRANRRGNETGNSTGGKSDRLAGRGGKEVKLSWMTVENRNYAVYGGFFLLAGVFSWGVLDEDSPPAKVSEFLGFRKFWDEYIAESFNKPVREKLLPDWPMPHVPQDIPCPFTLVLDLEETLIHSTWDKKYGWRHAKRPGVDKFLSELSQYYEIVLFSPGSMGMTDEIVTNLDKNGAIMHRLYREATRYVDGVYIKDLDMLNRDTNKIVVIDDEEESCQLHPDNLIRVKPFVDPTDKNDDTLLKLVPILIEIAKQGYSVPKILSQFRGMDADEIVEEQRKRIDNLRTHNIQSTSRGLGGFARRGASALPEPELPAGYQPSVGSSGPAKGLTAKDLVGEAPPAAEDEKKVGGVMTWYNNRAKEQAENQARTMEKWQEVMMKKQMAKEAAAKAEQSAAA